jgi:hypothetical protein
VPPAPVPTARRRLPRARRPAQAGPGSPAARVAGGQGVVIPAVWGTPERGFLAVPPTGNLARARIVGGRGRGPPALTPARIRVTALAIRHTAASVPDRASPPAKRAPRMRVVAPVARHATAERLLGAGRTARIPAIG